MIKALNKKGYDAFSISIPSVNDLVTIFRVAAPVFVMMMSKVNSPSWLDSWFRCILWFHFLMGFRFLYAADSLLCIDNLYCYIYGYICCGCSSGLFAGSLVLWSYTPSLDMAVIAGSLVHSRSWFKHSVCALYGVSLSAKLHCPLCLNWCMGSIEAYQRYLVVLYVILLLFIVLMSVMLAAYWCYANIF